MSNACTPILVGVNFPVSEILLLSKRPIFPLVIKKFNLSELAQKFKQVGMNVKCMYTNFGGCEYSVSEILLLSKMANFPFRTMGYRKVAKISP